MERVPAFRGKSQETGERVGSGSPADGVAEAVGVVAISVGVGTGGSSSVGSGEAEADAIGAAVVGTGAADGALAGGTSTLLAGAGAYCASVTGREVGTAARRGAVPMPPLPAPAPRPPVPLGAPIEAARGFGVASVQPIATEIGSPRATIPKKTDLGVSRTWGIPVKRPKR